jgi:hypothetical protein
MYARDRVKPAETDGRMTYFSLKYVLNIISAWPNRVKRGYGLKEHQKAVSTLNRGKSALAEHVCDTKHGITWENSKVVPQTIIVPHKVVLWSKTMPRCVAYKYE